MQAITPGDHMRLRIGCAPELADILIAELSALGYEGFSEDEGGLEAWIAAGDWPEKETLELREKYAGHGLIEFGFEIVPATDWNREWERNFHPVELRGGVRIRASFHSPSPDATTELIIDPRMAFGTGHHQTTRMMLEALHMQELNGLRVLDVGTGTGILAIMALKSGARFADVTDIDPWSIDNCRTNFDLNGLQNYRIHCGSLRNLTLPGNYELVLANINKNTLIDEMRLLSAQLAPAARLLMSGFYEQDLPELISAAQTAGLMQLSSRILEHWATLELQKTGLQSKLPEKRLYKTKT